MAISVVGKSAIGLRLGANRVFTVKGCTENAAERSSRCIESAASLVQRGTGPY
ncbi:hypothetical protein WN48_08405 [Eufriesea mexicana]|uniref:Uncharacterized protein n=1 Tax=Eufriesea mexicana TaxID=516756 RepID=A0A310SG44_9HYME|nr:hypothetical protein WN48_08405 [Eufriesea mexicana]